MTFAELKRIVSKGEDSRTQFKAIIPRDAQRAKLKEKRETMIGKEESVAPDKSSLKTPQKTLQKTPQKTPQKILYAIRQNPFIGTQEMAYLIGVERSTVARAIAKLKSSGRLRRVGPDKGGHWEVAK